MIWSKPSAKSRVKVPRKRRYYLYAKTGVIYPMPRNISKYGRPLPYFMKYRSEYYAKQDLSRAPSNMNKLCWDIEHWERGLKFKHNSGFDWRIMLADNIEYSNELFSEIEKIFLRFCKETSTMSKYQAIVRKYESKEVKEKFTKAEALSYMADWDIVYEKYKHEVKDICPDETVSAQIAVRICYEKYKNKGMKFPWVIAPDGIVKNIKMPSANLMPVLDDNGDYEYLGKKYSVVDMAYKEITEDGDDDYKEYD